MNCPCLFCGAIGKKPTMVSICAGMDTVPDYLCDRCTPFGPSGGLWTLQHMKDYIHKHLEEGHIFLVYYNSETTCDDGIEGVHTTLAGAVEWVRKNYDEPVKLYDAASGTKGVNMRGWSIGSYNIYRVPLKK